MNTDSENILKNNFVLHFNYLFVKIRDNSPATAKRSEDGWLKYFSLRALCSLW